MPAIAPHSTATSEGAWDGPKAKANLRNDGDRAYYRSAFAWVDPAGDPATKASYRFIHHEVGADGAVGAANIRACQSAIGVLNGGRGGTTIPDADRQGVYNHLARHIRDAGMEPPDLRSASDSGVERRVFPLAQAELRATGEAGDLQGIEGRAAIVDVEADIGPFREIVRAQAFDGVDLSDCLVLFNHNPDYPLGRPPDTATVEADSRGLAYAVPQMPKSRADVLEAIQRRDVRGGSFSFSVSADGEVWHKDGGSKPLREITKYAAIYDVGPVTMPAFADTTVSLRSLERAREAQEPAPDAVPDPLVELDAYRLRVIAADL